MIAADRPISVALSVLVLAALATAAYASQSNWTHWGGDANNRRFSDHSCLNFSVGGFKRKWTFPTGGSVLGTPGVCGGAVHFCDNSGTIYKLNATTGKQIWSKKAKDLLPGEASVGIRVGPVMSPDCKTMYLCTQQTKGAYALALNTGDGSKKYSRQFDSQPVARCIQSGILFNNVWYVGVASQTEGTLKSNTNFKGSMYALNAADGSQKWKRTMCPAGYTGCAVWGSSPAIDIRRNQVCVGTGNNYEVPGQVLQCVQNAGNNLGAQRACAGTAAATNFVDSIVCMDLGTGKVKWARALSGLDVYLPGAYMGVDEDFAQGVIAIHKTDTTKDVILGTNKGGRPIGLDPTTGKTKWGPLKRLAPQGYAMWGSCSNNKYYCVGLFFFNQKKGNVMCIDVLTGIIKSTYTSTDGGIYGALTCTQKYVMIPKFDTLGSLVAMEIETGKVVGSYQTGHALFCGPAMVKGVAYMGSGYDYNGGTPGNSFHAVSLPLKGTC